MFFRYILGSNVHKSLKNTHDDSFSDEIHVKLHGVAK